MDERKKDSYEKEELQNEEENLEEKDEMTEDQEEELQENEETDDTEREADELKEKSEPVRKKPRVNIAVIAAIAVAMVAVAVVAILMLGNEKENDNDNSSHIHVFGEWSIAKEASCIQDGVKERYCECGEKQSDAVYATGHKFGNWNVAKEATCAEQGIESRACECGETEEREIAKTTTHTEVTDLAVDATCQKAGLTEGKHCSVCGTVFVEQTETPILSHRYIDKYDVDCEDCGNIRDADCRHSIFTLPGRGATCTKSGLTEGKKCSLCGEITVAQSVIPASGHTEGNWIVEKEPTCTEKGSNYKKCTVCDTVIRTEEIAETGHTGGEWITEIDATCTVAGSKHKECTVCGGRLENGSIPAKGHTGGDWIIDLQPSCTTAGSRHKHCSVCQNDFESESISAKGHTSGSAVKENQVTATCQSSGGYDLAVYCTVSGCGAEISRNHVNENKKSHNYVNYICSMCQNTQSGVTLVYDLEDLVNIKNNLRATYVLMNDIDCEGFAFTPIGTDSVYPFTGVFDGQGHTISNYLTSSAQYIGIFGYNAGTIKNVNIAEFDYDITSTSYDSVYAGGLVGYNAGVIEKCACVDGDIYMSLYVERGAGLICGWSHGKIKNCYATGSVYITQPGTTTRYAFAAGIVARNDGDVENCFVDATLHAYSAPNHPEIYGSYGEAAMITAACGSNATISNCFAKGNITEANNRVGDMCGYCHGGAVITNCYNDSNMVFPSSCNTHNYATDLPTSSMSSQNFYSMTLGWDSDIWDFTNVNLENKVYPTLIQN